jgi:hypothetical protein
MDSMAVDCITATQAIYCHTTGTWNDWQWCHSRLVSSRVRHVAVTDCRKLKTWSWGFRQWHDLNTQVSCTSVTWFVNRTGESDTRTRTGVHALTTWQSTKPILFIS